MRQHQTEETPKPEVMASPAMEEVNKKEKLKSWGNDGELEKILSKGHKVCLVNGTYKKCSKEGT